MTEPKTIYRKDYQAPNFLIAETHLDFDIQSDKTLVKSKLLLRRNGSHSDALVLNGEALSLQEIAVDGVAMSESNYQVAEKSLTLMNLPDSCELTITVEIDPKTNTALEGLYSSNGMYCTQCEAEGFRRITYYLDRPDVMSVFTTTITADKSDYPILLSNGNKVSESDLEDGRHQLVWHDPFPKPCYLFALVAGDLAYKSGEFITQTGRKVALEFYVEPKDLDKLDHAMNSLKASMTWDEQTYGLEYDLDQYMIVAVSHFNMGAMENKGLNVFNTSCVLASPDTATDAAYQRVEAVIAHEYFHNWSGNRVTCRDWFQLSLKEGFTVFRDAQFSADMNSATVKRIEDVALLKTMQFAEDAGPQAHPIRPDSFITIDNFYTLTIYEKGAEVIRMLSVLLGWDAFKKGSDLYFERHDGQAVTCDDFVQAMQDSSGYDLTQFKHWYSQAGTPTLTVMAAYDAAARSYTLTATQATAATPGQDSKLPFVIPIKLGLLNQQGESLALEVVESETMRGDVWVMTEPSQTLTFKNIALEPVPSLLQDFSAPVNLEFDYSDEALALLMQFDSNHFNRWQAGKFWAKRILLAAVESGEIEPEHVIAYSQALEQVMRSKELDDAIKAEMLKLPNISELLESQRPMRVQETQAMLDAFEQKLGAQLEEILLEPLQLKEVPEYAVDANSIAERQLRNRCLYLLVMARPRKYEDAMENLLTKANNLTDRLAALRLIVHHNHPKKQQVLSEFYDNWKHESLVLDQWFAIQATNPSESVIEEMQSLIAHDDFDWRNPNRLRSVIASFCRGNLAQFYREDGAGLQLLAQAVETTDALNPQIAARLAGFFNDWGKLPDALQSNAKQLIEALIDKGLSNNTFEILSNSLKWYE